jgi:hypothetical protein
MRSDYFKALLQGFVEEQRAERNKATERQKLLAKIVKDGDSMMKNLDRLEQINVKYEEVKTDG